MDTARMIRIRTEVLERMMEERDWTTYRLAKEAGIKLPVAYRLMDPKAGFKRLDLDTLEALCRTFDEQPGAFLEYRPERAGRGKRG